MVKTELVLTKGFLIHIPPENIGRMYQRIYEIATRYILIAEYYNPIPVMVPYRGHDNMLWKRDFAGEMMQLYPELSLVDYGFVYHLDIYSQDDLTWFLLEKSNERT